MRLVRLSYLGFLEAVEVSPQCKEVFLLLHIMKEKGELAIVDAKWLGKKKQVTSSTAYKWLLELEKANWIRIIRRGCLGSELQLCSTSWTIVEGYSLK